LAYNSTIISKKKVCVNCGKKDYWFSNKMCKQCATVVSTNKRIERFAEIDTDEEESIRNLIEDIDTVYSLYIRIKHSNSDGLVSCYTCDKVEKYTKIDCGHFIPRANLMVRWNEHNTKPQCVTCNQYKDGNIEVYRERLDKENNGISDWLSEQARQIWKPTRTELKELLSEYRHKLELVKRKLK